MKILSISLALIGLSLSACATMETPRNYSSTTASPVRTDYINDFYHHTSVPCAVAGIPHEVEGLHYVASEALSAAPDLLAAGDRVRLTVAGDHDTLSGNYIIAADGRILLLGRMPIVAAGKTIGQLDGDIRQLLLNEALIRALPNTVRVQLAEQSGVPVAVTGAVFEPGVVRVGERAPEARATASAQNASGDLNVGRTMATALRAAGGIRPDADARAIYLIRGDKWTRVDVSGALDGHPFIDLPVTPNDRVIVPSLTCLQVSLIHPSVVTSPGIRVFMSNLSRPAASNASSAIGHDTTSLPYGTRLLQGLISANCVGGSGLNAARHAVLISRNPLTGQSLVIQRSVEALVRNADRDEYDPYLMPNDSIACYDSGAMNVQDVISTVSNAVTPYVLLRGVTK